MGTFTDNDDWRPMRKPWMPPDMCQVLTAWGVHPTRDMPEFIIGLYDNVELAQQAREAHRERTEDEYDYCIEPWPIQGRIK